MGDDDEDIDYDEGEFTPSYAWNRDHVALDALEFAASIAEASAAYLRQLSLRAGAHSNHGIDRHAMHMRAAQEIESLTNQEG